MKKMLYILLGITLSLAVLTKMRVFSIDRNLTGSGKLQSTSVSEPWADKSEAQVQKPIVGWVIVPEVCRSCQTGAIVDQLKILFPGLQIQYVGSQESQALELIKLFQIKMLPAYVFSKELENSEKFAQLSNKTIFNQDRYYLDPSFAGVSYILGRMIEPQSINLFVFLTHPDTLPILNTMKELEGKAEGLKFTFHLVGDLLPQQNKITSPAGSGELTEDKLYVCVDKYYPQKSWEYLTCRLNDRDRLWLDDCLIKSDIEKGAIKNCLESDESEKMLETKIKLSQELGVSYAPLILLDNVEIFGVNAETSADEILSIIEPNKIKPVDGT